MLEIEGRRGTNEVQNRRLDLTICGSQSFADELLGEQGQTIFRRIRSLPEFLACLGPRNRSPDAYRQSFPD